MEQQNSLPIKLLIHEFVPPRCYVWQKCRQERQMPLGRGKTNAFYWKHKSVTFHCRWNSSLKRSWIRWRALRTDWLTGVVRVHLTSSVCVHKQSQLYHVFSNLLSSSFCWLIYIVNCCCFSMFMTVNMAKWGVYVKGGKHPCEISTQHRTKCDLFIRLFHSGDMKAGRNGATLSGSPVSPCFPRRKPITVTVRFIGNQT